MNEPQTVSINSADSPIIVEAKPRPRMRPAPAQARVRNGMAMPRTLALLGGLAAELPQPLKGRPGTPGARDLKPIPPPVIKAARNKPCPCGSGKKFKHCHINTRSQAEADARCKANDEEYIRIAAEKLQKELAADSPRS